MKKVLDIFEKIKNKNPLVFHVTNMVTINDCANMTLAVGASPIMSFSFEELEDIVKASSSIVLNIGTMDSDMKKIAYKLVEFSNRYNKPITLDAVGAGFTKERLNLVKNIVSDLKVDILKGNMGEIKSLIGFESKINGVDSLEDDEKGENYAILAAKKYNCISVITGKIDYVSDGERVAKIENGNALMKKITGTGCMLSSIISSFSSLDNDRYITSILAVLMMGIAGEKAAENYRGIGSYKVDIFDKISTLTKKDIEKYAKLKK